MFPSFIFARIMFTLYTNPYREKGCQISGLIKFVSFTKKKNKLNIMVDL